MRICSQDCRGRVLVIPKPLSKSGGSHFTWLRQGQLTVSPSCLARLPAPLHHVRLSVHSYVMRRSGLSVLRRYSDRVRKSGTIGPPLSESPPPLSHIDFPAALKKWAEDEDLAHCARTAASAAVLSVRLSAHRVIYCPISASLLLRGRGEAKF